MYTKILMFLFISGTNKYYYVASSSEIKLPHMCINNKVHLKIFMRYVIP